MSSVRLAFVVALLFVFLLDESAAKGGGRGGGGRGGRGRGGRGGGGGGLFFIPIIPREMTKNNWALWLLDAILQVLAYVAVYGALAMCCRACGCDRCGPDDDDDEEVEQEEGAHVSREAQLVERKRARREEWQGRQGGVYVV